MPVSVLAKFVARSTKPSLKNSLSTDSKEYELGGKQLRITVLETTAPDGYSGAIQLLVGADFNGTVLGTRVTEHHETPGLGDKIELRLSDWITHFAGKKISGADDAHWAVKKDGGDFDQFTGATITPRAVVNAVKRAGLYAQTLPSQLSQLPACGE